MGDFGSWFRSALHTASMDRAEFSHRSGVPQRTVGAWFTGSRVPSSASCDRIADVLLLDRDEVLAAAGHRPMDEPLSADDPRRGIIALVRRLVSAGR
jgi:transcriptional regulator with XRE-family HTH domain